MPRASLIQAVLVGRLVHSIWHGVAFRTGQDVAGEHIFGLRIQELRLSLQVFLQEIGRGVVETRNLHSQNQGVHADPLVPRNVNTNTAE